MNPSQIFFKKLTRAANLALNPLEPLFSARDFPRGLAPVFVIGAPRSGSTLLYQTLVNRFDFGYLSNFHCKYYGFPSLAHRLAKSRIPNPLPHVEYQSEHGKTEGEWSPSECGEFWYRWFRRKPVYVPMQDADKTKMKYMRRAIAGLTNVFQKPLLFKNLYCSLRLAPIHAAIPESVFIVIHRDPFQNAQSLLLGRQRVHGNFSTWWSAEPPNIEHLRTLPPEEQVAGQIAGIYQLIERDSQTIGAERFLHIQYERFCADVNDTMSQVHTFLNGHKIQVNFKGKTPDVFNVSNENKLGAETSNRLHKAIQKVKD